MGQTIRYSLCCKLLHVLGSQIMLECIITCLLRDRINSTAVQTLYFYICTVTFSQNIQRKVLSFGADLSDSRPILVFFPGSTDNETLWHTTLFLSKLPGCNFLVFWVKTLLLNQQTRAVMEHLAGCCATLPNSALDTYCDHLSKS